MEAESLRVARHLRGLRVMRPYERLSENAILQNEANLGSTGLISNSLAGV